jgi:arsenite methyltransferase
MLNKFENMSLVEINKRYSVLADSDCCLSCGGAANYANVSAGEVCVDLGSGRGTDVLRLADTVGPGGFVYGIDISDGMIDKAQQTAKNLDVKNVRFIQSQLEKIDIPENSVDIVISNCTINHASDKQLVWNEIFRILNKGGRFVVSDIYATCPVPDEYKNDPVAISECWAGAVTRTEYFNNLESAGFSSVKILEESDPYNKGKIMVSSFTIAGKKPSDNCCCCGD